jgi:hypothetical protein
MFGTSFRHSKDKWVFQLIDYAEGTLMIDRRTSLTILFLIVSLLCPIAVSPISDTTTIVGYAFLAPFLGYDFGNIADGITIIIGMEYWAVYVPLVAPLSFLFLLQVIRSMKGKTPQNRVFYSGILSLIFPSVFLTWMYLPIFFITGLYGYAGPIPIQFILGMSLVSRYGYYVEELDWSDEED